MPSTENTTQPSILLAVVSREEGAGISPFCALNLTRIGGAKNLDVHVLVTPYDLVRARSRCAAMAREQNRTHILFWDGDVSVDDPIRVVQNMLAINEDVVFTMYPRKRVEERTWPIAMLPNPKRKPNAYEIMGCGMGLTLISRHCLDLMWEHSRPFDDTWGGVTRECRAMFMLEWVGRELLSEDYSFCHRWRSLGGQVWLNALDVADHFGATLFEGEKRGSHVNTVTLCPECGHALGLHAGGPGDRCAGAFYSGGKTCDVCVG